MNYIPLVINILLSAAALNWGGYMLGSKYLPWTIIMWGLWLLLTFIGGLLVDILRAVSRLGTKP